MEVGDKVQVRTFSGSVVVRRVVADTEDGILVCTEEEYAAAKQQGRNPQAIGWPEEYIVGKVDTNGATG